MGCVFLLTILWTNLNVSYSCRVCNWTCWGWRKDSPKCPMQQVPASRPSTVLSYLPKTETKNRQFPAAALLSNSLTVFNLPVFEWIINVVAMKTKEVNRIQLSGKIEPSDKSYLSTEQPSCWHYRAGTSRNPACFLELLSQIHTYIERSTLL